MKKIFTFFAFFFIISASLFATITGPFPADLNNQTPCINTAIDTFKYATSNGVTGASFFGLPAGVTGVWANDTITISGTPAASGSFPFTVNATGGNGGSKSGTITVLPNRTVSVPSSTPTLCINTALTAITRTTTGATGIGAATGLPAGVTAAWLANVITVSGTPTASGTFNYSIPLTGGCGSVNATGTITVTAANSNIALLPGSGSSIQTMCINTPINNINYWATGATGASFSNLPPGVTGSYSGGNITISDTAIHSGIYNYTVTLTGGCGNANAVGTITVTPNMTAGNPSLTPTLCINTSILPFTIATTLATGIDSIGTTGLPPGVSPHYSGNLITITGTPTWYGPFNYSIPLTGGCGDVHATGTITVLPLPTLTVSGDSNQTVCPGSPIDTIVFTFGGSATSVIVNNLPDGLTPHFASDTLTITGTPTESGNYTVTTVSSCTEDSLEGSINIIPPLNLSPISGDNSVCGNQQGIAYGISPINVATYDWNITGGTIDTNGMPQITVNWGVGPTTGSVTVTVTDSNDCISVESISVSISPLSAIDLNDIVPKINTAGDPYILIYPNPPQEMYYQWYKNDTAISGANKQFYYPPSITPGATLKPGEYYKVNVALLTNQDCGNFTNSYQIPGSKKSMFNISPNPNDGNFIVNFGIELTDLANSTLVIYSIDGKIVQTLSVNNQQEMNIDLTSIRNGFYLVQLTTGNGNKYIDKLIIK